MKITVIGTGYVGLVVGTCLAETGNEVVCIDVDETKIQQLRRGKVSIYEPGLDELVSRNIANKRLMFRTGLSKAVRVSDVVFIAVGTPQDEDGSADVKHVLLAARDVARVLKGFTVVAVKSTVPVGTSARVQEVIAKETNELVRKLSAG